MWDGGRVIWSLLIGLFRSRATLEAENLVLRQQILVLRRTAPKRLSFNALDRLILVGLYRLFPDVRSALAIVRPETVVRWHRAGFRAYWRWKSRPRSGRPKVPFEIRQLIRDMSLANPLWGAPRIRRRTCRRMSRPYRSRNEIVGTTNRSIAATPSAWLRRNVLQPCDGGRLLRTMYLATLVCPISMPSLSSSPWILWLGATTHPTAEWIARQLIEACGWKQAPHYLVHDRDRSYGEVFLRRVRAMGIRDRPTSPRSPWQNGYAERLIGSIRRECIDHVVVLGERHLRHVLLSYQQYYNETRTHLSLDKDAPIPRAVEAIGRILSRPVLGGLHHQYVRT